MNVAVSNTKEIALEQAIERHLTGMTSEDRAPSAPSDDLTTAAATTGPYRIGRRADFDPALALDTAVF